MAKKYIVHNTDYGTTKEYDNVRGVNVSCMMNSNHCWVEVVDDELNMTYLRGMEARIKRDSIKLENEVNDIKRYLNSFYGIGDGEERISVDEYIQNIRSKNPSYTDIMSELDTTNRPWSLSEYSDNLATDTGEPEPDDCFNLPDASPDTQSEWEEFETWRDDGNQFWTAIVAVIVFLMFVVGTACLVEIVCRYIW